MSQPRLLGGRYQLDGVVGQGGMAEVHRARDVRLDRTVAVKTLRSDLARDHTFQARFRREAQSAASLNHPSIIAVYDTGEDTVDGISIPYIVMEYVDGRTLKDLLDDDRRLLPERTVEIADGVLRALEYSHRNGIVHRDIKPANVMLTRQAEVKVMDFGIARSMNDSQATMTQTSQVIGTAQYLSPEQARGERVDSRSDLYSTGCVLYEALVGHAPFTGDSPVSIAYQHVRENPVPPTELDPEIPKWIEEIVLKAMAKAPDQRYQSAEEMRQDIQRGLSGVPTEAGTMAMAAAGGTTALPPVQNRGTGRAGAESPEEYDDYDDYEDRRGGGGAKALWALLALAVLGALVLAVWLVWGPRAESVDVPDVAGEPVADAQQELQEAGFSEISEQERSHDEVESDHVIETDPSGGTEVTAETEITLVVSTGPGEVEVPDVAGQSEVDARQELQELGLNHGGTERRETEDAEPGTVLSTTPGAGTAVEPGTTVDFVVAEAISEVSVPDLTGMNEQEARTALEDADLSGSFRQEQTDEAAANTVLRQDPAPGETVAPGSQITVTIAEPGPSDQPSEGNGDGENGEGEGGDGDNGDGGDGDGGIGEGDEDGPPGVISEGMYGSREE